MATTINAYSVGLSLNAAQYIRNAQVSRSETAQLRKSISDLQTPAEKASAQLELMQRAFASNGPPTKEQIALLQRMEQRVRALAQGEETLAQKMAKQNKEIAAANQLYREQSHVKASAGLERYANSADSAGTSIIALGKRFMGLASAAFLVRDAISKSFEVQRATASLEVLMGSASAAEQQLRDLREIDAASPLSFASGLQATRTLLAFGAAAEDVTSTLRMLGDVTGADNERFKSMALAFAQVSAAGRLQGQDLRQMIDAGFNPLQEISRQTGESLIQLKARMEAGAISSQEVAAAFRSATSEGGRFNGMMDKMAETSAGQWGRLVSSFQQTLADLGESLGPMITQFSRLGRGVMNFLQPAIWLIGKMADGLAAISAAVMDVIDAFGQAARGETVTWFKGFWGVVDGATETSKKATAAIDTQANAIGVLSDASSSGVAALDAHGNAISNFAAKTAGATVELSKAEQKLRDVIQGFKDAAKQNADSVASTIGGMQRAVNEQILGKPMLEQVEFIKNLLDMRNDTQRVIAKELEDALASGTIDGRRLRGIVEWQLDADQKAQLEKYRSLKQQTSEMERQAKVQRNIEQSAKTALENARKHFEQERQRQMKMRQDIQSMMSGAGAEVGSGADVAYNAQRANEAMARTLVPPKSMPTDEELLAESKRQLMELQQQTRQNNALLMAVQKLVEKTPQFKRMG